MTERVSVRQFLFKLSDYSLSAFGNSGSPKKTKLAQSVLTTNPSARQRLHKLPSNFMFMMLNLFILYHLLCLSNQ